MAQIDMARFHEVQQLFAPHYLVDMPDDIAQAPMKDLAERFDASVDKILAPEQFQGNLPDGSKAGSVILPNEVSLDIEIDTRWHGTFHAHPGWTSVIRKLKISKDEAVEGDEPLERSVTMSTGVVKTPILGESSKDSEKSTFRSSSVELAYQQLVRVPLNVAVLSVAGLPVNPSDEAVRRVDIFEIGNMPDLDTRLGFAVSILLLEALRPEQLEPVAKNIEV